MSETQPELVPDEDRPSMDPTEDEVAEGNHLGVVIDVNDDTDTGAREEYK